MVHWFYHSHPFRQIQMEPVGALAAFGDPSSDGWKWKVPTSFESQKSPETRGKKWSSFFPRETDDKPWVMLVIAIFSDKPVYLVERLTDLNILVRKRSIAGWWWKRKQPTEKNEGLNHHPLRRFDRGRASWFRFQNYSSLVIVGSSHACPGRLLGWVVETPDDEKLMWVKQCHKPPILEWFITHIMNFRLPSCVRLATANHDLGMFEVMGCQWHRHPAKPLKGMVMKSR